VKGLNLSMKEIPTWRVKIPVNPSGGVISTNCIGATALLRVAEAAIQIMGKGGKRQFPMSRMPSLQVSVVASGQMS